ncbi:MAG: hypothetical protein QX196_04080 [Methylococcaceae bacterium]
MKIKYQKPRRPKQAFPARCTRAPETPPRATPFDTLRTGLGGLIPAYTPIACYRLSTGINN